MHCWKAYHVNRKHLFFRRFFISFLVSLFVFIAGYLTLHAVSAQTFDDDYFLVFLCSLILLYPVHKLCHILPIVTYYKYMKWEFDRHFYILPVIHLQFGCPIPKAQFGTALVFPFIILNAIFITGVAIYPQFGHYFTILLSYHNGLSVFDLLLFKSLLLSPKHALVEENEDGYEILVENDII
ncbi:DUF3267 domain-containing protein [Siminovitchia sediminis]|uniref:DUF3267 domain-containing protein n=1 Tax=Siminovitchia sediminis TaxID=1274353 RepID=A0ABW4KGR7_9BACI